MSLNELSSLASPLSAQQVETLKQFSAQLTPVQLAWVSGYLAASANAAPAAVSVAENNSKLTILYGSQTGNSRGVATELANQAKAAGVAVNLVSMGDYNSRNLKQESLLAVVVSTQGEGEAPDDAIEFHKFLASKRAPKLDGVRYAVLSLGDSSYEFFCQTGKEFDERLAKLGAEPLLPRVDCDLDYQQASEVWQSEVIAAAKPLLAQSSHASAASPSVAFAGSEQQYSKQQPYTAEVIVSQKLTSRDSAKDTRHVEIDLGESGISYRPGDALGVYFNNDTALVESLLSAWQLDGDIVVTVGKESVSLQQALLEKKELTQLYPGLVKFWAEQSKAKALLAIIEDKTQTREFVRSHQVADLQQLYPLSNIDPQTLVDALRPLTPRLYSIASSQAEVDSEVHLTVGLVADERNGEIRYGGASRFLAHAEEGANVKVYVESNKHFRLPENPQTPVIMIGPGTGVAPFRAFMQQRANQGDAGKNWLFFGNPHFEQDFLYQTEWQQYLKSGVLSKISLAFSRDQQEKIYVQHRIQQQGAELWQWLQQGAHLYLCGDAERMAKDVQQALTDVVAEFGEMDHAAASEWLEQLRAAGRFQKDVY
ncbi:sulfite reductase [NADPH] flavoprotein alpha-component [Shewanella mangrovi]|uniref:Sulfite reductase [NADPH] flavoprotein alpha-component n=1 Tax=Shewanella mangrovi TaxID=1515746 RepID=A0A094JGK9_9GAMM|nr:assimilatory sulfite reductase (NADPH) flavoprotein subunit [Shewanella mangrovi]KFZ39090.1 sulfite reductase [NADPH] flavoprotein alpha-component [Shewanella mangrovi]